MASPSLARTSRLFRWCAATAAVGAAASVGAASLLGGSVASCLSARSYVYFAQKYDPTGDCLEAARPVEVVNGSGASGTCKATCITVDGDVLVSTMCPPLPAIATELPADAGDCVAALKAVKRGGTCDEPADGGEEDADMDTGTPEPDAAGPDAADGAIPIEDAADAG